MRHNFIKIRGKVMKKFSVGSRVKISRLAEDSKHSLYKKSFGVIVQIAGYPIGEDETIVKLDDGRLLLVREMQLKKES